MATDASKSSKWWKVIAITLPLYVVGYPLMAIAVMAGFVPFELFRLAYWPMFLLLGIPFTEPSYC